MYYNLNFNKTNELVVCFGWKQIVIVDTVFNLLYDFHNQNHHIKEATMYNRLNEHYHGLTIPLIKLFVNTWGYCNARKSCNWTGFGNGIKNDCVDQSWGSFNINQSLLNSFLPTLVNPVPNIMYYGSINLV